jgi:hypothetical protein
MYPLFAIFGRIPHPNLVTRYSIAIQKQTLILDFVYAHAYPLRVQVTPPPPGMVQAGEYHVSFSAARCAYYILDVLIKFVLNHHFAKLANHIVIRFHVHS